MKKVIKIKRKVLFLILLVITAVLASGCNFETSKNVTFAVETGDSVNIKLDTTGGFDMNFEVPFSLYLNSQEVAKGTFIYAEAYDQYKAAISTDEGAELLDSGTKDGNPYVFWEYDGSQYNYAVMIDGSDTAVLVMSTVSREAAEECFDRLTFTLV